MSIIHITDQVLSSFELSNKYLRTEFLTTAVSHFKLVLQSKYMWEYDKKRSLCEIDQIVTNNHSTQQKTIYKIQILGFSDLKMCNKNNHNANQIIYNRFIELMSQCNCHSTVHSQSLNVNMINYIVESWQHTPPTTMKQGIKDFRCFQMNLHTQRKFKTASTYVPLPLVVFLAMIN
jgi:hypothetical protein